jgi:hypothetical protein
MVDAITICADALLQCSLKSDTALGSCVILSKVVSHPNVYCTLDSPSFREPSYPGSVCPIGARRKAARQARLSVGWQIRIKVPGA